MRSRRRAPNEEPRPKVNEQTAACVVARVTHDQREFFRNAGGARWVRQVIDACIEEYEKDGIDVSIGPRSIVRAGVVREEE